MITLSFDVAFLLCPSLIAEVVKVFYFALCVRVCKCVRLTCCKESLSPFAQIFQVCFDIEFKTRTHGIHAFGCGEEKKTNKEKRVKCDDDQHTWLLRVFPFIRYMQFLYTHLSSLVTLSLFLYGIIGCSHNP